MFENIVNAISLYAIPFIVVSIVLFGVFKKVNVYETFTDGAKDGFKTAVTIIPFLVGIITGYIAAICVGIVDFKPIAEAAFFSMPQFIGPLSGGGASGVMNDLFTTYGPDSLIGRMASVMNGSTETTFYVLAVYFGAVGIKKTRHALPAGLIADAVGLITAVVVTNMMF